VLGGRGFNARCPMSSSALPSAPQSFAGGTWGNGELPVLRACLCGYTHRFLRSLEVGRKNKFRHPDNACQQGTLKLRSIYASPASPNSHGTRNRMVQEVNVPRYSQSITPDNVKVRSDVLSDVTHETRESNTVSDGPSRSIKSYSFRLGI
jgi:hypothetical protein